jgi:AP-1 complex subunit gamma-1
MAAVRILRKCPDLTEDFLPKILGLLEDRSHGVLIGAVTLAIEILEFDHTYLDEIRRHASTMVKVLKNLLLSGYAPEHDISGITDPFLQVKILKLLRLLGHSDSNTSDEMNDTLA